MRRSAPAIAALLLLAAVGCDLQTDAKEPGSSSPSPTDQAKPLNAEQARQVVKNLNRRMDVDSQDATFWREVAEGPWLDQRLATVDTAAKYGTKAPPEPTNSTKTAPDIHAWTTPGPDGTDRWILAAYETAGWKVGDTKKSVSLIWSLYHQRQGGPWRKTLQVEAPSTTALPKAAARADGQAVTGGDTSDLAAPPSSVCGLMEDYVMGKENAEAAKTPWSKQIDTGRTEFTTAEQEVQEQFGAASVDITSTPTRTPHGPLWRTTDGGALVACVSVTRTAIDMGPGRYSEFTTSGWAGTTGIRWAAYTQSMLAMTVLKIPAGTGEVSIAAKATWPYTFDGTRYTGS
jgi:hypothetical protein